LDINIFRKVSFTQRPSCMVCGKRSGAAMLEMKNFPMTEIYTREVCKQKLGVLDQGFFVCRHCGHGQLGRVIDVKLQYGNYHFRSGQSVTGQQSAKFFIDYLDKFIADKKLDLVVEIGCNDLYLLKLISKRAKKLVGIDPILKGREKELSENNVIAQGGYLEDVSLQGSPDLFICKDTLEHVANPKDFLKKVIDQGHSETLFAFQFPLLDTLLDAGRFDQIFHQHLNYFSMHSIKVVLEDLGCELVDFTINHNLWGSIIIIFRKAAGRKKTKAFSLITRKDVMSRYKVFRMNMEVTKQRLSFLKGKNVYGYGAALMLPVLDYHLDGAIGRLTCIMDDDINKKGLRYINLDVDIKPMNEVHDLERSAVILTAIASLYNVRAMLSKLSQHGPRQIIVPLNTL